MTSLLQLHVARACDVFLGQLQQLGYAPAAFDWNGDGTEEPVDFGLWVSYIGLNSPADVAGLKVADVIVEIDDVVMEQIYHFNAAVRGFQIGQVVNVEFLRKNLQGDWEKMNTQVMILEKPADDEDEEEEGGGDGNPHN